MAYYPAHITADWERFEYYVARYVPCPACGGKLSILDRNAGAIDHACDSCGAGVQVKFSKTGPKRKAAPSSATEWRKVVRKVGARRIYFLTGNRESFRVYRYTDCKRSASVRVRAPKHMTVAEAKRLGRKVNTQERYSFTYPAPTKAVA
jgi:hypothetical protein